MGEAQKVTLRDIVFFRVHLLRYVFWRCGFEAWGTYAIMFCLSGSSTDELCSVQGNNLLAAV